MKRNNTFEKVLIILVFITTSIVGFEAFTQKYLPEKSILHFFHQCGYLTVYPIIYEPSKGIWHIVGWTGSSMMLIMMLYSVRKRFTIFRSLGSLRHWLSAHIFLGIMGPIFVTFHTTFKFGGIIATSFWCMIVTMVFGIMGRYIYVQIPRDLSGTELETNEIDKIAESLDIKLNEYLKNVNPVTPRHEGRGIFRVGHSGYNGVNISDLFKEISIADEKAKSLNVISALFFMIKTDIKNLCRITHLKNVIRTRYHLKGKVRKEIVSLLKKKAALIRQKNFLATSHRLLHYWHVLHVPLAVVMFLIMFLHIIVYFLFGAAHRT